MANAAEAEALVPRPLPVREARTTLRVSTSAGLAMPA